MRDGVTIVGLTNLPSTMPFHASQLYARNVIAAAAPPRARGASWRSTGTDEITAGACVDASRRCAA